MTPSATASASFDPQLIAPNEELTIVVDEVQRSIFHPVFRVDKSRSREYGGAGLGLSLVWEIADLHGGSVWVEESSDKGTTIAVDLPAGTESDPSGADIT